jgi:hypothetical protein
VHAVKVSGGVVPLLHLFLTSALGGENGHSHAPGQFTLGQRTLGTALIRGWDY